MSGSRLLDPATLAAIGDLALAARLAVEGMLVGAHASRRPGAGLEFTQYRSYQPGDDLRRVDWKLFGRSDRYFLRESETETSLTVRLVVDATASMGHAEGTLTKLDAARLLAAALAWLAARQGDAVGLWLLRDRALDALPPRRDHAHLHRLLHALERARPAGRWPAWPALEEIATGAPGRGLTVVISDFHEHAGEIGDALARLAALRHDVLALHVVGRHELEFPYEGAVAFEDLETGRRVEVAAARAGAAFRAASAAAREALRRELEGRGIQYARFAMHEPLDEPLRAALRARLGRS
ncbi:MAG TPA: DUF58 domain-containing protein [Gemmatimonadales bacterium]|nr:DUF58 domain-containing protein [Gemmatimonadales bacterium]